MKTILKKVSAAVLALAVMVTAVVFDVPGKIMAVAASSFNEPLGNDLV